MNLRAGTSGYSYAGWKGNFYPERLRVAAMLQHYAARLPAVEINNTFYRLPKASVLETWRRQVPEQFRFSIKASRRITHFKRLQDVADEIPAAERPRAPGARQQRLEHREPREHVARGRRGLPPDEVAHQGRRGAVAAAAG